MANTMQRIERRRPWIIVGFMVMAGMWLSARSALAQPAEKKPNIVLVLMDNLGWGEPGCYGGGILRGARRRGSTSWRPKGCAC